MEVAARIVMDVKGHQLLINCIVRFSDKPIFLPIGILVAQGRELAS